MSTQSWLNGPPRKVLLATDLSFRCDRALSRVASLVAEWQAELVVVHVVEDFGLSDEEMRDIPSWRRPANPVEVARRQVLADVAPLVDRVKLVLEKGDPADAVIRTVESEGCDLVVTGVARDELLGRFSLGSTVNRLLRRCPVPVLVVKNRPRGPYRNVVVAIDFSESSRHALEAAAHFFPEQRLTLLHAFETPMEGLMANAADYWEDRRKVAARQAEAFVENAAKPASWQEPHMLFEHGAPDRLVRGYAQEKEVDLVVLGTHGRSALFEIVLGSVAKEVLDSVPCDALVVREPRAAVEP